MVIEGEYHKNGQLEGEGVYKAGKMEGMSRLYHENGQLKTEQILTNGKLEGMAKEYDGNGQFSYT